MLQLNGKSFSTMTLCCFVVLQSPLNANLQQRSNRLNADGSKYQSSSQHISTKQSTAGAVPTHHSTQNKHKSGVSYTEVSNRTPVLFAVSLNKISARLAQSSILVDMNRNRYKYLLDKQEQIRN